MADEKLKQQSLYDPATDVSEKNLLLLSKYVSGTEGSTGVYQTKRVRQRNVRLQKCKEIVITSATLLLNTEIQPTLVEAGVDAPVGYFCSSCRVILERVERAGEVDYTATTLSLQVLNSNDQVVAEKAPISLLDNTKYQVIDVTASEFAFRDKIEEGYLYLNFTDNDLADGNFDLRIKVYSEWEKFGAI